MPLEEVLWALQREGLVVQRFVEDPPELEILVSQSCHESSISLAHRQAHRALRVCSCLTGSLWFAKVAFEVSSDQNSGSVSLSLRRSSCAE
jgi:hypothetical protein